MAAGENGARRVALGMSGGVDSALSPHCLCAQAAEVVGVATLHRRSDGRPRALATRRRCVRPAGPAPCGVGMPPCSSAVVQPFVDAYAAGLTPSHTWAAAPAPGCPPLRRRRRAGLPSRWPQPLRPHRAACGQRALRGGSARSTAQDQSYIWRCSPGSSWRAQCCRWAAPRGGGARAGCRPAGASVPRNPRAKDVLYRG